MRKILELLLSHPNRHGEKGIRAFSQSSLLRHPPRQGGIVGNNSCSRTAFLARQPPLPRFRAMFSRPALATNAEILGWLSETSVCRCFFARLRLPAAPERAFRRPFVIDDSGLRTNLLFRASPPRHRAAILLDVSRFPAATLKSSQRKILNWLRRVQKHRLGREHMLELPEHLVEDWRRV